MYLRTQLWQTSSGGRFSIDRLYTLLNIMFPTTFETSSYANRPHPRVLIFSLFENRLKTGLRNFFVQNYAFSFVYERVHVSD